MAPRRQGATSGPLLEALVLPSSRHQQQQQQLVNPFLDGSIDELDLMRLQLDDDDDELVGSTSCWNAPGGLQLLEPDSWPSECGAQQSLAPGANNAAGRRKKRRNRQPKSSCNQALEPSAMTGGSAGARMRAGSLSSASTGSSSSSPPATCLPIGELRCRRQQLPFVLSTSGPGQQMGNNSSQVGGGQGQLGLQAVGGNASAAQAAAAAALRRKQNKLEFFGDRVRQSCGANGIFSRRLDFSAFNSLPRNKLNSYHIKMEDEGNHGNDDTRCFILSTLAGLHRSRVTCVLCRSSMPVFDRYPLVDGTFFLSPRQHSASCAEVKIEGRTQYLSAVCMVCLEGSGGSGGGLPVRCRSCTQPWDGSSLVLGTMYSYDIFAAMPCCTERLKCNSCQKLLIYPHQRLNFYSDYSRVFACPHCRSVDAHFVKPLDSSFTREHFQLYSPWP